MPQSKPFYDLLVARVASADSLLCIGLDPVVEKLPQGFAHDADGVTAYLKELIAATSDLASCYKPNLPFYLSLGDDGLRVLRAVRDAIPANIPLLLDCKVNDLGDTAKAWARMAFDYLEVDGVVVNPYMGEDALAPYFAYSDKGVIVLCKTSNPGSGDLQDLVLESGDPLYMHIASSTRRWQEAYPAEIGMVVGATYPDQLARIRATCPKAIILLPGLGAQGGDVQASVSAGVDTDGGALLCASSRSIMYASNGPDFAEAARVEAMRLRDEINLYRYPGASA